MGVSKYAAVLNEIKNSDLVTSDEIIIVGQGKPSAATGAMFGAIGAAAAQAKLPVYVIAVSSTGIKLFDVERKTGKYLGTMVKMNYADTTKFNASGLLTKVISAKYNGKAYQVMTGKKMFGIPQAEELKKAMEIMKPMNKK